MDLSAAALVATGATVLVAASLHSAIGFGFALVTAPVLFAVLGPQEAVGTVLVLGPLGSLLILASERRRPQPLVRDSALILLAAAPGAFLGVVVLRSLSDLALQIGVTASVLVALVVQHRAASGQIGPQGRAPWSAPLAGFAAGALTTSTSTNSPPMLLHLLGREISPVSVRDTLNVGFLGMGVLGAIALAATGTDAAAPTAEVILICVPMVVLGNYLGRRLFGRLARSGNYELVLTGVLAIALTAGLAAALV